MYLERYCILLAQIQQGYRLIIHVDILVYLPYYCFRTQHSTEVSSPVVPIHEPHKHIMNPYMLELLVNNTDLNTLKKKTFQRKEQPS